MSLTYRPMPGFVRPAGRHANQSQGGKADRRKGGKGAQKQEDQPTEWSDDDLPYSLLQLKNAATCLVESWQCMSLSFEFDCHCLVSQIGL